MISLLIPALRDCLLFVVKYNGYIWHPVNFHRPRCVSAVLITQQGSLSHISEIGLWESDTSSWGLTQVFSEWKMEDIRGLVCSHAWLQTFWEGDCTRRNLSLETFLMVGTETLNSILSLIVLLFFLFALSSHAFCMLFNRQNHLRATCSP